MKKKLYLGLITVALGFNILGCGKIEKDRNNSSNSTITNTVSSDIDTTSNLTSSETTSSQEPLPTDEPEETQKPKIKKVKLTTNKQYSDVNRIIEVIGLKEYKTLQSDEYTDKAAKGKKFLVLFLSIKNTTSVDDYIHADYISAKVDGKKISHTFLVNQPKGYPTIFTHVKANSKVGGFIVWEVPKSWKKLEFEYTAWKDSDNLTITAKFTPKDLFNPVIYNLEDYTY